MSAHTGPSDNEKRRLVVKGLSRVRAQGRPIYESVVQVAECAERSKATVYRWVNKGAAPERRGPKPYCLTKADRRAVEEHHGCFSKAWRARTKSGLTVSRSSFIRACGRAYTKGELATMREGYAGHLKHTTYMKRHDLFASNQEWQIDAKMLDIFVAVPRRKKLVRPWIVAVIDAYDRGVRGFTVCIDRPNEADVLAALYDAIRITDTSPLGGIPENLVTDNGLEFLAAGIRWILVSLGINAYATDAYSPHQKGVIERWFRTLVQLWEKEQALWVDGPRKANGELVDARGPMEFDQVVSGLEEFIRAYNLEHEHSALGGKTPKDVYDAGSPPQVPADEELRGFLARRIEKKVTKHGIRHNNKHYLGKGIDDLVEDTVLAAIPPNDPDFIEVFSLDGEHLLTAVCSDAMTGEQREEYLGARRTTALTRNSRLAHRKKKKARKDASKGTSRREQSARKEKTRAPTRSASDDKTMRSGLASLGLTVFSASSTNPTNQENNK